jgi:hypothetical protein
LHGGTAAQIAYSSIGGSGRAALPLARGGRSRLNA